MCHAKIRGQVEQKTLSRILAVDDDLITLTAIEEALLVAGHEAVTTEQPEHTLELLGRQQIDAMVLDVRMPGISGFELLGNMRRDPRWRLLPVLLLSSDGSSESRVKGLRGGADDYLVKPFVADELIARLERIIARRSSDTGLQGSLERFPVQDLLQYLGNGNKTGFLELANRITAMEILFREGRIVAAAAGRLTGREAVLEALTLTAGFFHFQHDERPSGAPVEIGLQGVLLESVWLEDELSKRHAFVPPQDLPLKISVPTGALADFEELPTETVVNRITDRPGTNLRDLLAAELAASAKILLTIALLRQRGNVIGAPEAQTTAEPVRSAETIPEATTSSPSAPPSIETSTSASDLSTAQRLGKLLRVFAQRGYDHRQGHLQIFFQKPVWNRLLELLETIPEDLLPGERQRLFSHLNEQGRGVLRLPLDRGSLLLHLQPLDAEKPPKSALFEISGGSILWIADENWNVAHETCVGFIEHSRKKPRGLVIYAESPPSGRGALTQALESAPRWREIPAPPCSFEELVDQLIRN